MLFVDPFLVVICNGRTIFKSEVLMTTLNPNWPAFKIEMRDIGNYSSVERLLQVFLQSTF